MSSRESFVDSGFLSRDTKRNRHNIHSENRAWFEFSDQLNAIFMQIITVGTSTPRGGNWSPEAVSIRLLMRTTINFQGVIKLSELGMIAPARTLVRTIVEDSFCAAALQSKPHDMIDKLKKESDGNREKQARFISEKELTDDENTLQKLREALKKMAREKRIDWKNEAENGILCRQYLNYMRLSDDAVHTSALSLNKHLAIGTSGKEWSFTMGPGQTDDITSTLHRAALAAMPVAIMVSELILDHKNNSKLKILSEKFKELPEGNCI